MMDLKRVMEIIEFSMHRLCTQQLLWLHANIYITSSTLQSSSACDVTIHICLPCILLWRYRRNSSKKYFIFIFTVIVPSTNCFHLIARLSDKSRCLFVCRFVIEIYSVDLNFLGFSRLELALSYFCITTFAEHCIPVFIAARRTLFYIRNRREFHFFLFYVQPSHWHSASF